jgi:hypothetical protein
LPQARQDAVFRQDICRHGARTVPYAREVIANSPLIDLPSIVLTREISRRRGDQLHDHGRAPHACATLAIALTDDIETAGSHS